MLHPLKRDKYPVFNLRGFKNLVGLCIFIYVLYSLMHYSVLRHEMTACWLVLIDVSFTTDVQMSALSK